MKLRRSGCGGAVCRFGCLSSFVLEWLTLSCASLSVPEEAVRTNGEQGARGRLFPSSAELPAACPRAGPGHPAGEGRPRADGGPNPGQSEGTELPGSSRCHRVTEAWQNRPSGTLHVVLAWSGAVPAAGWRRYGCGSSEAVPRHVRLRAPLCRRGPPPGAALAAGRRLCERGGSLQPSKS